MATVEDKSANTDTAIPSLWERGITLQGVSWDTYCKFVDGLGERRVFVTYDSGMMEIELMSPSFPHESGDRLLERLVYSIALLKNIPVTSGGSVTHRREDLEKGMEPDACFWIANASKMKGVIDLDLTQVPPPDLVIEMDIHASSLDRIQGFAKLGVPEIWHVQDGELRFLVLTDSDVLTDGDYAESATSRSFPFVDCQSVGEGLSQIEKLGETEALNNLLAKLKLR